MPRVVVGMLSHETNPFSPIATDLAAFQHEGRLLHGQEALALFANTQSNLGAWQEAAVQQGWELVPSLVAAATPSGVVAKEAYQTMKGIIVNDLRRALAHPEGVAGMLLALHGAMLAEGAPDAEGDLAEALHGLLGNRPLVVTLDLHGNLTRAFCAQVQGVFGFDTNPHVDAYERAHEAAAWLGRILRGEVVPQVAVAKPPLMPPTINLRTAEGPMATLFARARQWEEEAGIANVSVFGGFPYADFDGAGMSVAVTADARTAAPGVAQRAADDVAALAVRIRHQFLKPLTPMAAAVAAVLEVNQRPRPVNPAGQAVPEGRPLILADVADNPGGGGSGDTTELLRALVAARVKRTAVGVLWDPAAVARAVQLGVGAEGVFYLGGLAAPQYGAPLAVSASVRALAVGRFRAWGPMGRGMTWDMGPAALLDIDGPEGVQVVIATKRMAANDQGCFTSLGLLPARQDALVVKSRGHFRAAFEPIAERILEVDAPGPAHPDLTRSSYRYVRRPLFPLDDWED